MDFWCFFVSKTVIQWKYGFFAFGGRNTNFRLQTEWLRLNDQYFIRKEFTYIESWFYNFLCFFAPKTVFLRWGGVGHQIFWIKKSIFFDFSEMSFNHFLSMNMAWKCVLGTLGASFEQFWIAYDGIISPCKNLKFSKHPIFLRFFGFFDVCRFGRKKAQKYIKMWIFFQKHAF